MARPIASTMARLTTGMAPCPSARRWARARPTSCSSGRKKPGARMNVANHTWLTGANCSSLRTRPVMAKKP